MKKFLYKILLIILVFTSFIVPPHVTKATNLTEVSDTISTSWPSMPADHTIIFKTHEEIPAGGKIEIRYSTSTEINAGFNHSDMDLAYASAIDGPYIERTLATSSSPTDDGVTMLLATSTVATGTIIELNSSFVIPANSYVRIKMGTNAEIGEVGDRQILNYDQVGSYKYYIITKDASDNELSNASTFVVMVDPVTMSNYMMKIRSNGTPSGVLNFGTTNTIMSLTTNYRAICRYNTASGTPYTSMLNTFDTTGDYYHSSILSGLAAGTWYYYYIRCRDSLNVDDTWDYVISFYVQGKEGTTGGEDDGSPGGGGGGSGGGSGGGAGQDRGRQYGNYLPYPPPPGAPGVVLTGWAYPNSIVSVLQDGVDVGIIKAGADASFGGFLEDLDQGVYTFSLWSEDMDKRRSMTYSTTFWIDDGTQTVVSDILLSPTIELGKNEINGGEILSVMGQSSPNTDIEVWVYPEKAGALADSEIIKTEGSSEDDGKWTINVNTNNLKQGNYWVKAKAKKEGIGESGFSQMLKLAVEGTLEVEACAGADLNGDGKVNITDFSILLFHWGTDNDCADQNNSGNVDLIDFSIMMFYWTG